MRHGVCEDTLVYIYAWLGRLYMSIYRVLCTWREETRLNTQNTSLHYVLMA